MKCVVIIKAKRWIEAKKEVDTIEFAVQDVNGVVWATFDPKTSKVDVEYDDDEDDFDITDIARAIQNTGKFQVVSLG